MEEAGKANEVAAADNEAHKLPPPPVPPPAPGKEQTAADSTGDLSGMLTQAAQGTSNSNLKMELERVKRSLSDGASAQELKEAAAAMERAAVDNNDAVRQIAAAARGAIEAQRASLEALKAEFAALRATVESRATHS
jgi:hypothetical protein